MDRTLHTIIKKDLPEYLVLIYSLPEIIRKIFMEVIINLTIFLTYQCIHVLLQKIVNNSLYLFSEKSELILPQDKYS